jgi:hypothetical protein
MKKNNKILLSSALDILYTLEDNTGYENEKIGNAINLLQDALTSKKEKKKVVKYAVKKHSKTEATIIVDDGGIVTIHHNEFHLISTYYQERADKFTFDDEMWENLAEGKEYMKDWEDKQVIDEEVIFDAIEWMNVVCHDFKKVSFNKLVKEFNNL